MFSLKTYPVLLLIAGNNPMPKNQTKTMVGRFCRGLLGLSPEGTAYARRGFRGASAEMRSRLQRLGAVFLNGYPSAVEQGSLEGGNASTALRFKKTTRNEAMSTGLATDS